MTPAAPLLFALALGPAPAEPPRGVVLVMADDMGFGQTGYPNPVTGRPHPALETPHLDAMAAAGLRLTGFRSAGFTCSPTRASVLTGRTPDRTGVRDHGFPLNPNEVTLPQLLNAAGYRTAHFGKWHLNGLRGPGVPILADDPLSPGRFGYDTWLGVTNFFDRDPLLSREGTFEPFAGDSSEIIVAEAVDFIGERAAAGERFFVTVWYGSPHSPFVASEEDLAPFADLPEQSAKHYAELRALDRSLGTLRAGLREAGVAGETLVWFCSDNGGLPRLTPPSTGGLRGHKGTIYGGGLRVPAVVEWPGVIEPGRVSDAVTVTSDILPTVCAAANVDPPARPLDGVNLLPLFTGEAPDRERPGPLGFRQRDRAAWLDGSLKLLTQDRTAAAKNPGRWELYDLAADPAESRDLSAARPGVVSRMAAEFDDWSASVDAGAAGADYGSDPISAPMKPRQWAESPAYAPFLDDWRDRPEYRATIRRSRN